MSVDVKFLIQRQTESAGPIERAITNLKKVGKANLTKRRVKGRLDALRQNWKAFWEGHGRIINIRDTSTDKNVRARRDDHDYLKTGQIYVVEELFLDAQEFMETLLDGFLTDQQASGTAMAERSLVLPPGTVPPGHRLPKIDFPKFYGNPRDWISFRDLFFALVGSSTAITNVEKLHYLKTSLSGVAAQRVESIALRNDNFAATWDYLSSVYDDKRMLVNAAMRDFIEVKPVVRTSGTDLDRFNGEVTRAITALETLGQYTHHCDAFVVYLVVSKLDANTVREWEESLGSSQLLPTWVKLMKFLEVRARSLQAFELAKPRPPPANTAKTTRARHAATAQAAAPSAPSSGSSTPSANPAGQSHHTCSICDASHYIASCQVFGNKTPEQRKAVVIDKQLCFNCLGHHKVTSCRSQKRCQTRSGLHHTLIHSESTATSLPSATAAARPSNAITSTGAAQPRRDQQRDAGAEGSATVSHVVSRSLSRKNVLLTTAFIRVQSHQGAEVQVGALLDTGSELSFISEPVAQLLKLLRQRINIPLIGIGAQRSGSTRGAVTCTIRPHFNSGFRCQVDAVTLPKLTAELSSLNVQNADWTHLHGLQLADPDYAAPGRIDIILGSDVYGQLLDDGVKRGSRDAPVAHRTKLGWVLSGPTSSSSLITSAAPAHGLQCSVNRDTHHYDIQDDLQRFWIQEEVQPIPSSALSQEEEECEAHFLSTHSRDSSDLLGDSRAYATRMLSRMQKRLVADATLHELYSDFLQSYELLGHMRRATDDGLEPPRAFYLPHHGVLKDSTSTKLRVVFNGSARTTSGHSLNDLLHTGAKLQTDLCDVILRWQRFQFALAADIEKMFRQILVHEDDWNYQPIRWAPNSSHPITDYQLTTVTYGLGPAPFLAIRVLQQLVKDEGHRFPLAAEIIRRSTYVDDTFGGEDTLQEAQRTVHQLDNLCMTGGFKLQKWIAYYSVVLSDLPDDRIATTNSLVLDDEFTLKTLGIVWKPTSDSFEFSGFRSHQEPPYTKRKVLSRISQLFDPLGWLSPVMIRAKIFMQDIWLAKVGWDDELTETLLRRWLDFLEQLETIPQLSVPRWLGTSASTLAVEIHGFSDASEQAMASVVYLRTLHDIDDAHLALLGSKTKVAPLKRMTTPRLELTAATLLARHVAHIRVTLKLEQAPVHLWTDSTVTLAWIQAHPSRWKDYVRNRTSGIHDAVPTARWHHVPGQDNPADCASRGLTPQQLKEHRLWWKGPDWLARHSTSWPIDIPTLDDNVNLEERGKVAATTSTPTSPT